MTIFEMLGQSGLLTVLGMLVVFSFIIVLIICMHVMHFLIDKFVKEKTVEVPKVQRAPARAASVSAPSAAAQDEKAIVAAIAAAIYERDI